MAPEEWLLHLDRKLERLEDHAAEAKTELAKYNAILQEHIRRTVANEQGLELLKSELKPLANSINGLTFTVKIVGFFATLVGIAAAVKEVFF